MKNLRLLAILLLDDENGINEAAYNEPAAELSAAGHTDILNAVTAQDGRFYLGEDDAQDLLAVAGTTLDNTQNNVILSLLVTQLNKNNMKDLIANIAKQLQTIEGTQFASFTYLSKKAGELARHTLILGFSYHNLVEKSVTELENLMTENADKWTPLQKQVADNVMASLKKTLAAHAAGTQNEDYTKKDQYVHIGNGLNLNTVDNTLQLFGLAHNKVVLVEGVYPVVNSRPLTIEQNKIKAELSISKFREFALDLSQVAQAKINGNTLEMEPVSV